MFAKKAWKSLKSVSRPFKETCSGPMHGMRDKIDGGGVQIKVYWDKR